MQTRTILTAVSTVCLAMALSSGAKAQAPAPTGCSAATIAGTYAIKFEGYVTQPTELKLNALAVVTFDSTTGMFSGPEYGHAGAKVLPSPIGGTYAVNADCTGMLDMSQAFSAATGTVMAHFAIVEHGKEMFIVVDSVATQIGGEGERVGGGGGDRDR